MAGITLKTDLTGENAVKMVMHVAKDLKFAVYRVGDWELRIQKGSLLASIFVGAFVAYCDFRVFVEEDDGGVDIVIERNRPWWTGAIGVGRVKSWAKTLASHLEDEIKHQGGKVRDRKDS